MQTKPTAIALQVFEGIQRGISSSVFLCEGEDGPRLSFGVNRTGQVEYDIHLRAGTDTISLESGQGNQFALLLDERGSEKALRLVIYLETSELPVLEYNGADPGQVLTGYVLITAKSERGTEEAVIHAVFSGVGEDSLLIDASPQLCSHLTITTHAWRKEVTQHVSSDGATSMEDLF